MSKVQTLLKVISIQKEHPEATDAEIAEVVGISERYLRKCKKDIASLSSHLSKPPLERTEADLLLSKLSLSVEHERGIYDKLLGAYIPMKDGLIRMAKENDLPSNEYLQIGLWTPKEGTTAHVDFWLTYLLNSTLFWVDSEGEIDYRLAEICEKTEGYNKWRVLIKKNLSWSDGKPLTGEDVIDAIAKSRIAPFIKEVKKGGKEEILFTLFQDDVLFPYRLSYVPILPSHVSERYSVINGPYRLKKNKQETTFHLYKNKDYFKTNHPFIDWIKLKTFKRSAFAVKAVISKNLDLFPLRSIHQLNQVPQSFPFKDLSYYLLLINKERGCLTDESNIIKLKESIDYNQINLYLSGTLPKEIFPKAVEGPKGGLKSVVGKGKSFLDLKIGYLSDVPSPLLSSLALIVASSLGTSALNVVDMKGYSNAKEAVDVIVTQLYFGLGYSRLKDFFHSKGEKNTLGFNYPEIDFLIDKLEKTAEMKERSDIGQEVIFLLQEESAIILLAPCFEYFLSNLYIVPDSRLSSLTELILNFSNIYVKRGKVKIGIKRRV